MSILKTEEIRWAGELIATYAPLSPEHRAFHESKKKIRWLFGGNQSGKSYTSMMDLTLDALELHPFRPVVYNAVHWVAIESWELVRDVLWTEYLKKFLPPRQILTVRYGQDYVPRKIQLRNGHIIEFKAFNQGRELFQARQIDSCHCDEQCSHDFIGIFREIQARLMTRQGYLAWSLTPILPQSELEERIESSLPSDEAFYCNLNANRKGRGGYVEDEEIDRMVADWPKEVQATRIEGRFASFFGAVFKEYNRATHLVTPFGIPKEWPRYRTFDFGFTNPFVCLWIAKDPDENYYVYKEYYQAKRTIGEHIPAVLAQSRKERYTLNVADPENAADREELERVGIETVGANKDIARGIEEVQKKLKVKRDGRPSLFIFRSCRNLARELSLYHYPKGTNTTNPRDIPVKKNDHTVDALRYLLYTLVDPHEEEGSICAA